MHTAPLLTPPRRDLLRSRSDTSSAGSFVDVVCVEKAFLEGSFREALTLANRCLKQQAQTFDDNTVEAAWPLLTPLHLQFDVSSKTRYISFHWGEDVSDTNACSRAAAIALQSWYELSKQQDDDSSQQGYRFLQPFLDTYTSTAPGDVLGRRVMPMELLIVWIQFLCCRAVNHVEEAIAVAAEVLQHVRCSSSFAAANRSASASTTSTPSPISREACRELVILLFTELLPRHATSVTTDDVLRSIAGTSYTATMQRAKGAIVAGSKEEKKAVVQQCLCFCNTDDGNWPDWMQDSFRECRVVLQGMLRKMYHQEGDKRTVPTGNSLAQQLQPELTSRMVVQRFTARLLSLREIRSWKDARSALRLVVKNHLQWLRALLVRYSNDDSSMDRKKKQIQAIALVLCLTFCWRRHRQRISGIGQKALETAVVKPALEILEAFGVVRGN
jgi:hypothetical protein